MVRVLTQSLSMHLPTFQHRSISAVASILWVITAYVFTVVDSFTGVLGVFYIIRVLTPSSRGRHLLDAQCQWASGRIHFSVAPSHCSR
jgi:hypothetical protein